MTFHPECPKSIGNNYSPFVRHGVIITFLIVARRPQPEEVLSPKELNALRSRLQMMSGTAVQDFYRGAHLACRIGPGHFPSPRNIQELVQAWRQMRKWR